MCVRERGSKGKMGTERVRKERENREGEREEEGERERDLATQADVTVTLCDSRPERHSRSAAVGA